jgi:hypothetical protein
VDLIFHLIDLDHFKRVNDSFGQAAGDAVLRQAAQRLKGVLRGEDELIRWGGEELLPMTRGTPRRHAAQLAEKLRRAVDANPAKLPVGQSLKVSCSIGFAPYPRQTAPGSARWSLPIRRSTRQRPADATAGLAWGVERYVELYVSRASKHSGSSVTWCRSSPSMNRFMWQLMLWRSHNLGSDAAYPRRVFTQPRCEPVFHRAVTKLHLLSPAAAATVLAEASTDFICGCYCSRADFSASDGLPNSDLS